MPSVAIVGCGWFGLPLAKALMASGYRVKGSKRTQAAAEALALEGIEAYRLDLDNPPSKDTIAGLFQADYLVVNIPPALRSGTESYLPRLKALLAVMPAAPYKRIIFISTTGVYPVADGVMTESDAEAHSPGSATLLAAESLFSRENNACILRFAGLVGPRRHPGRFMAGKQDLAGADAAVNLVHLDDCIRAVEAVLAARQASSCYNICATGHPGRKAFYGAAAADLGLEPPQFNQQTQASKIISSEKFIAELGFQYRYGDPLDMLSHC